MARPPKRLSPQGVQTQPTQQVQVSHQKVHHGPLPAPEDLQRYDELLPGAAERIIAMAEMEQRHRHEQEKKAIASELATRETLQTTEMSRIDGVMRSDKRGQYLGAFVSILAISGAIYIAESQPWVAGALVGLPILGIVKALRNGPTQQHPTDKATSK
ncbi:MAG: DUF2335 domain-containing protein [Gallionellaceae bacterium]|nr:DUF2335 domain-containing protein [Gallionellaceae bacterium]